MDVSLPSETDWIPTERASPQLWIGPIPGGLLLALAAWFAFMAIPPTFGGIPTWILVVAVYAALAAGPTLLTLGVRWPRAVRLTGESIQIRTRFGRLREVPRSSVEVQRSWPKGFGSFKSRAMYAVVFLSPNQLDQLWRALEPPAEPAPLAGGRPVTSDDRELVQNASMSSRRVVRITVPIACLVLAAGLILLFYALARPNALPIHNQLTVSSALVIIASAFLVMSALPNRSVVTETEVAETGLRFHFSDGRTASLDWKDPGLKIGMLRRNDVRKAGQDEAPRTILHWRKVDTVITEPVREAILAYARANGLEIESPDSGVIELLKISARSSQTAPTGRGPSP